MSSLVPDALEQAARAEVGGDGLLGSWSATRWQYASRARPGQIVDVVTDLHGSVTLSLSPGTWVLTWAAAGHGGQSLGGTFALGDDRLLLRAQDADGPESLFYRLAAATLALRADDSAWDFDGSGEEAAEFVAVLVRI